MFLVQTADWHRLAAHSDCRRCRRLARANSFPTTTWHIQPAVTRITTRFGWTWSWREAAWCGWTKSWTASWGRCQAAGIRCSMETDHPVLISLDQFRSVSDEFLRLCVEIALSSVHRWLELSSESTFGDYSIVRFWYLLVCHRPPCSSPQWLFNRLTNF